MAVRSLAATTWQCSVAESAPEPAAWADASNFTSENNEPAQHIMGDAGDRHTNDTTNDIGVSSPRSWPRQSDGTANGNTPRWWKLTNKMDVLASSGK